MKKIIFPILTGMLLLSACQNNELKAVDKEKPVKEQQQAVEATKDSSFPYQNLLSEVEQSYSLLVIGEIDEQNPIEDNKTIAENVNNILSLPTLEMAQKAYPELHIESEPAYLLFDNNGVAYQSSKLSELTQYLESK